VEPGAPLSLFVEEVPLVSSAASTVANGARISAGNRTPMAEIIFMVVYPVGFQ
jgi:hypothetical protein